MKSIRKRSLKDKKTVIGMVELVDFIDYGLSQIPAKVDTGAYSSSVWASNIQIAKDKQLSFCFFDKDSPYYTGQKILINDYYRLRVRSSGGHVEHRYVTVLKVRVGEELHNARFTLADRSQNRYSILLGRTILSESYLVDVSIRANLDSGHHQKELKHIVVKQ